jgi:hypothetical protein
MAMAELVAERLSKREAAYLEHLRAAKSQGLHLSQYCRRHDLKVQEWYQIRRAMVRKGIASRTHGSGKKAVRARATFTPVRIVAARTNGLSTACWIEHPSGWRIACGSLPAPAWLAALIGAGQP